MSDSFSIISDLRGQLATAHQRIEQLERFNSEFFLGAMKMMAQVEAELRTAQARLKVTNVLTDEDRQWAIDTARAMGMDEDK